MHTTVRAPAPYRARIASPPEPEAMLARASLASCLHAGLRGVLFLPLKIDAFGATVGRLSLLVALWLVANLAVSRLFVGAPGEIDLRALPGAVFDLPVLLLAGWLLARTASNPRLVLAIPVFAYAMAPFFLAVQAAIGALYAGGVVDADAGLEPVLGLLIYALPLWWWGALILGSARMAMLTLDRMLAPVALGALLAAMGLLAPPAPLWQA
ncbi:MAG: hypothetical protein H7125_06780, partial [Proteobacteria bacterium]|nr:hypothetical protein [Burkholderiales bacterium]